MCLLVTPNDELTLTSFSYANQASNVDDHKSMAAYCVFFGNTLVSWSSKKQYVVAPSSSKSKYRAFSHASIEVVWLTQLLTELGVLPQSVSVLWCDNISVGALATNPIFHAQTKHIEIDIHYVCGQVLRGFLQVRYMPSNDQLADCLTKSLTHSKFGYLRSKLGIIEPLSRLRGNVKDNTQTHRFTNLEDTSTKFQNLHPNKWGTVLLFFPPLFL